MQLLIFKFGVTNSKALYSARSSASRAAAGEIRGAFNSLECEILLKKIAKKRGDGGNAEHPPSEKLL